ncbi:MAG: HPF/RaiA family ribosome-associated protein [Candidatus Peregrinibacteria bacterium]|nr:HPF/RaiA family ribosome-associated protein [Candidatus Peregrinibacteria bacterium]
MKIQYSMKNMAGWEEKRTKEYMQGKIPRLERLLSHFQDDTVSLTVRAERFDKNNAYHVEGNEDSHAIEKAIDLSKDRLVNQMKKHDDQLKNKGKSNSALKRGIKELGIDRMHQSIVVGEDQDLESIASSESDSKPISTF